MTELMRFEQRSGTRVISLLEFAEECCEPERLRLKISTDVMKKPLDIGSFAYAIRGKNKRNDNAEGNPVVLSSFVSSRRVLIQVLLDSFVGLRDTSVSGYFTNTECFIEWLNCSGYKDIFASSADAQMAYGNYTSFLNENILHGKMKPLTASNYQTAAARLVSLLYPQYSHYITSGAVTITRERGSEMMEAEHVDVYRDVCLTLARQCRQFVLLNKPYPAVVDFGTYEVVVFPSSAGAITPFRQASPTYNAAERRIATVDEYLLFRADLGLKAKCKSQAIKDLDASLRNFQVANENERYWHRIELARLASKAYASVFLMITGASMSEFSQFTYQDALDVEQSPIQKELVSIKFRAGGKVTRYNLGRKFGLLILREYLELREWILNGVKSDFLFFSIPLVGQQRDEEGFSPLKATSMKTFYRSISGVFLDPKVSHFSPRKMRKQKSNAMHYSRISPSGVAESLNHSRSMNISSYSDATPQQQEAELSLFWRSVRHAAALVRKRSQGVNGEISVATGHCTGFKRPTPISPEAATLSVLNCNTQFGCLYCEHYICHSDEEDFHKLMSLQYVVNAVRKMSPDEGHAEELFRELSIRIEFLVDTLETQSESVRNIAEIVRKKVFDYGELTLFWERRLSRYEKMGVVF